MVPLNISGAITIAFNKVAKVNMTSLICGVKEAGPMKGKPKFSIDRILGLDKKEHRKIKPYRPWAGSPIKRFNNLTLSTLFLLTSC